MSYSYQLYSHSGFEHPENSFDTLREAFEDAVANRDQIAAEADPGLKATVTNDDTDEDEFEIDEDGNVEACTDHASRLLREIERGKRRATLKGKGASCEQVGKKRMKAVAAKGGKKGRSEGRRGQ